MTKYELAMQWLREVDRGCFCEVGDGYHALECTDVAAGHVENMCAEVRELRAALERARAALERERMELVSASVSVSRARELTLAQEIRANNLSAALERARAVERQLRIASDDPRASYETSRAYERAANDLEAALGVAPVSAQTCQECGHLESEHRSVAGGLGFACRHAGCDCIKQAAAPGGAA